MTLRPTGYAGDGSGPEASGVTDVPGGHGTLSLEGALALSCNTFFVELALSAGARLRARLERMGLDSGIDLQLPTARARLGDGWHTPEGQAQAAIGQGDMLVTPLHMAALYAAFANGGVLVRPNLIRKVTDAHGRTVRQWRPDAGHRVIGRDAVSAVEVGLLSAVEWGTASLAANPGRQVFGKTGTAENQRRAARLVLRLRSHRSGTAALSIVIENGGSGGAVAAPWPEDIIQSLLAFYEGGEGVAETYWAEDTSCSTSSARAAWPRSGRPATLRWAGSWR